MANEKKDVDALRAEPQVIDASGSELVSPHDLPENMDPAYAGEYQITHGYLRLAERDGKGEIVGRGRVFRAGAKLRLGAIDAFRFLQAKSVRRVDGKKPDRLPEPAN